MRDLNATGMQMQALLNTTGHFPVLNVEIFWIADDRVAQMLGMHTQLVRSAGMRLHFNPTDFAGVGIDHPIERHRMISTAFAVTGDAHTVAILGLLLDQIGRDAPFPVPRHTAHQSPISFLGIAMTEALGQRRGGAARLGDNQHT